MIVGAPITPSRKSSSQAFIYVYLYMRTHAYGSEAVFDLVALQALGHDRVFREV